MSLPLTAAALALLMIGGLRATAADKPIPSAGLDLFDGFAPDWRAAWREYRLAERPTNYTAGDDGVGNPLLRAESHSASSGLLRFIGGHDPLDTHLAWRWRVESPLDNSLGERGRLGDDYAARVWVVFERSWHPLRNRAICYVWAEHEAAGASYPNPFSKHMTIIVLRSGRDDIGRWREERRDLEADYRACFGVAPRRLSAVGVMTDTDNTGRTATTEYANLRFLPAATVPPFPASFPTSEKTTQPTNQPTTRQP